MIKLLKGFDIRVRIMSAEHKHHRFCGTVIGSYDGVYGVIAITGSEAPMVGLELGKAEPMDEEMIQAEEEDEAAVGWIPVTERLPERNKSVLLCMKSRSLRTGMCIQTGSYDGVFWFVQGAAGYESLATFEFRVLAWMPLPEPYREE